jgi:1-phosphofructokinase/tagatose 6-phosphate kinase
MIITVTLNAAVDHTVAVPSVRLGHRHRVVESRTTAGGKGVNVARALRLLGRPVIATGFVGGRTGERIVDLLAGEDVLNDFVRTQGESRTNIVLVDPTSGERTELNERGPEVANEELERFVDRLLYLAGGAEFCVIAGSIPPGLVPEIYGRMIEELQRHGVPCLLDTDGEPMRAGLRAEPAVVAPNAAEAEEAVGHEFNDPGDYLLGLNGLVEMGAQEAIVTREAGCVAIVDDDGAPRRYEVTVDPLEPVATVGSGDAFLAGYVAARHEGRPAAECLAYGVACGAQSTQHFGAGSIDAAEVERLLPQVQVTELDVPAGVG